MLILTRLPDESIIIDPDILVTVLSVRGSAVRLGIVSEQKEGGRRRWTELAGWSAGGGCRSCGSGEDVSTWRRPKLASGWAGKSSNRLQNKGKRLICGKISDMMVRARQRPLPSARLDSPRHTILRRWHAMTAHHIITPDCRILDRDGRDWSWALVAFRDVPGWPGYRASSQGHIFSCRTRQGTLGGRWSFRTPTLSRDGYLMLHLHSRQKVLFTAVHALVLAAFTTPRPTGLLACHNNGIRTDNRPDNLRWGTSQDNIDDRGRHGNTPRGERNGNAAVTESDVRLMRSLWAEGQTLRGMGRRFNLSHRQVGRIVRREKWDHVA